MKRKAYSTAATIIALSVTGCGQRGDLVRGVGEVGPAIPAGDTAPPTAEQQTVASTQARPRRSDEVLRRSEERQSDEYDIPPE
ncbi:MAG: lipoprotein [Sphingopyxis sp.]